MIHGDVYLENGLIKGVGDVSDYVGGLKNKDHNIIEADGAWLTPGERCSSLQVAVKMLTATGKIIGIFDIHSHITVDANPELRGTDDTNSLKGLTLPWLRSMDGINVHDEVLRLTIAGKEWSSNRIDNFIKCALLH